MTPFAIWFEMILCAGMWFIFMGLLPSTTSYFFSMIGDMSFCMSFGLCCPSPSIVTIISALSSFAASIPVFAAAPFPLFIL